MSINELHEYFQTMVYFIVIVMALFCFGGFCLIGCRKLKQYCYGVWRTVPKSSLAVMLIFAGIATIHAQKPVHVDSSVEESGDGTKEQPFKEIADAMQKATSSTGRLSVVVAPGVYKPFVLEESPKDANGDPLSITIGTYLREDETNGVFEIDAADSEWCLRIPCDDAATNSVRGFVMRNARIGVEGFEVSSCVISNCSEVAMRNCAAKSMKILNCGGGIDGGVITDSTLSFCTNTVLRDVIVQNCYVTNNPALVAVDSQIDTCLIENNAAGVSNCFVSASSILSNSGCGMSGDSVACNTLIAFNVDSGGRLVNFTADTVSMTNCCTAPMPVLGANNYYSAMPIYPETHKLTLSSPIFRNGDVSLLVQKKDLNGKSRVTGGKTDIGACFYAVSPNDQFIIPTDWYLSKVETYIENIIQTDGKTRLHPNTGVPYSMYWHQWNGTSGSAVKLDCLVTYPKDLVPYDAVCDRLEGFGYTHFIYYSTIVNFESGKLKPDGTPLKWWEEYVLGTDPTDSNDYFRVSISINEYGEPELSWNHNLGAERVYLIFGKKELSDEWVYINEADLKKYRFFKVMVDMP